LTSQRAPRYHARMRYKKILTALAMTFTFAAGLAPTAATAQSPTQDYQLLIRRGSNYSCIWADHPGPGAAIYRNRGSGCPSSKPNRWRFIALRSQGGRTIYHLQLAGTNNCLAITGTPWPGEDVQLERCVGGAHADDDYYFWLSSPTAQFRLRNSDPNYADYCLQADPNDRIGSVRIQVAGCYSANTLMSYNQL